MSQYNDAILKYTRLRYAKMLQVCCFAVIKLNLDGIALLTRLFQVVKSLILKTSYSQGGFERLLRDHVFPTGFDVEKLVTSILLNNIQHVMIISLSFVENKTTLHYNYNKC